MVDGLLPSFVLNWMAAEIQNKMKVGYIRFCYTLTGISSVRAICGQCVGNVWMVCGQCVDGVRAAKGNEGTAQDGSSHWSSPSLAVYRPTHPLQLTAASIPGCC